MTPTSDRFDSPSTANPPVAPARLVVDWLAQRQEHSSDAIAYWARTDSGNYGPWTWNELLTRVWQAAAVLESFGVRPGDRVAQYAENRTEWILWDLATHVLRAIHVPIHSSLTAPQVAYQVEHSGATVISCANHDQLRSVLSQPAARQLRRIALYQPGADTAGDARVVDWWSALAAADAARGIELFQQSRELGAPESTATILYTSGTTGEPKGVMLSQRNLVTNADATQQCFAFETHDVRLTMLPLSHIFARTCDLYTWLARGSQLALAGSRESVLDDARAVRPTIMNGVPYFFEVVRRKFLESELASKPDGLRQLFGGRIQWFCSGGAGLPNHLFDFYQQHGLPVYQGYGLTESSPVISLSTPRDVRRGSSGKPLPGVEVRLAEDAEILTRGPHVMQGYWRDPAGTAEVLRDGWLLTGDYGSIDADRFVYITGRKKELIVTSVGKNIAPVLLEGLIAEDPLVHQVMVVGDSRNYLTALIVPMPDALRAEIIQRQIPVTSPAEALAHPKVIEIYQQLVNERLAQLAPHEQVRNVALLGRAFSIDQGELTPKMSLRRSVIEEHFADVIAAMY